MATSSPGVVVSLTAAADLSAKQGLMMKISAAGAVNTAGDAEDAHGVLLNKPTSGQAASVQISGVAKVIAGTAITAPDNVGVDSSGRVVAPSASDKLVGVAITDAGAAGDWVEVILGYRGVE
jgi:phage-related tail fiber protein